MRVLLLYDTKEKDLARDLADFLVALDLAVLQIPLAADNEWTLHEKERRFFREADGAVFLLTPGCERNGRPFPSPSVTDEMGRAKERFDRTPGRVVYLVEKGCNIQSVDQKVYIPFLRADMRTVLEALTLLVRKLRAAGLLERPAAAPAPAPEIDIEKVWKSTEPMLRAICIEISNLPGGSIADLPALLRTKQWSQQDANLAYRKLLKSGLLRWIAPAPPLIYGFYTLSDVAWKLVEHSKVERIKLARFPSLVDLLLQGDRKPEDPQDPTG